MPRVTRRAGAVFAALADPTRRQVVELLSGEESATATELADRLPVTRQAVTKHLAALADADLVAMTRAGREVRYALRPEAMSDAVEWMVEMGARWDRRLASLGRHLRSKTGHKIAGSRS